MKKVHARKKGKVSRGKQRQAKTHAKKKKRIRTKPRAKSAKAPIQAPIASVQAPVTSSEAPIHVPPAQAIIPETSAQAPLEASAGDPENLEAPQKTRDTGLQAAEAPAATSVPSPNQGVALAQTGATIQSIFPGIWSNTYSHVGGESGSEEFQIVDGTKCVVEGKHKFNITGFRYDPASGTATFTKEWVGVAKAPIVNTIKRINRGHYEGSENDGAHVVYKRMR